MKAPRRQVIKEVKASGNSGSVYVPKEWIGHMVEIQLYNVEAMVLEALYPYLEAIHGIYLFGPHARGEGSPEQDIDVLVVADRDLPLAEVEGMCIEVVKADGIEEYVKEYPARFQAMVKEAVPIMNQALLNRLKEHLLDEDEAKEYLEGLDKTLAMAKSLESEGDLASAAYALIHRIKDYAAMEGRCGFAGLEEYATKKGIGRERFRKLYAIYKAKRDDTPLEYSISPSDVSSLYCVLEDIRKSKGGSKAIPEPAGMGGGTGAGKGSATEGGDETEKLTREMLLEKARRYREKYGGGGI